MKLKYQRREAKQAKKKNRAVVHSKALLFTFEDNERISKAQKKAANKVIKPKKK